MASATNASKKNFAIDWEAKIGGHTKTRTLVVKSFIQPTRHLAYQLAKADAQIYAKTALLKHLVVLGVRGVDRDSYYSTKESPGFSN